MVNFHKALGLISRASAYFLINSKKQLMKKIIPYCLFLGLLTPAGAFAQSPFTIHDLDLNIQKAEIAAVDIDGDGDKDLLLMGENPDGRFSQLYRNDGEMSFTPVESPFIPVALPTIDWGDVNGDGFLDMVQSGFAEDRIVATLFSSDGTDNFTEEEHPFPQMAPSIGMADLNNDGYTDVYVFGNHFEGESSIFFNDGQGAFTAAVQFDDYNWIDPQVYPVDYDNDGDLDLFIMAGFEEGVDSRFSRMFVNEGGTFSEQDLGLIPKGFGHAEWGDYDGDGDLDLLLNGDGHLGSGEDSDFVYRLYNNENGEFSEAATFMPYRQINVGNGSRFFDWDNDGDLDIVLTGWNPDEERQATAIFLNENGEFTAHPENAQLPGVSESAVEVSDLDNDGDLDIVINGFSGNDFAGEGSAFFNNVSLVIENPTDNANQAPSAPQNLSAEVEGGNVTFSWDAAEDDSTPQASLSYNLFLVNKEDGSFISFPLADTTSGDLTVQRMGNVQLNTRWTISNLPEGEYRWGVQAIDNSFAGSEFTRDDLSVSESVTGIWDRNISIDMKVYPNPSAGQVSVNIEQGGNYLLSVRSIEGREVKRLMVNRETSFKLAPGMYVLQAIATNGRERGVWKILVK
jgi:hypothetical protein